MTQEAQNVKLPVKLTLAAEGIPATRLAVEALSLARQGLKIFPCVEGEKHPACKHGFKDASCDETVILAWLKQNPNFNWGFEPGAQGWFVADLDVKNGIDGVANWRAFCELHGLPFDTYTRSSPSGGLHKFYDGVTLSPIGLLPGVDIRSRGAYVVIAGQIGGKFYDVADDRDIVEPDPHFFREIEDQEQINLTQRPSVARGAVEELDADPNVARARRYLADRVAAGDVAVAGRGGNNFTYQTACWVLNIGLSPAKVVELMIEPGGWNDACVPPWSAGELVTIATNATKYAQNESGSYAVDETRFADAAAQITAGAPAGAVVDFDTGNDEYQAMVNRFRGREPDEDADLPDVEFWDSEKTLPRTIDGSVVVPWGPSGVHKTGLVLCDCLDAIARGAKVVFAVGEGSHGFRKNRVPAIAKGRGIPLKDLRGKFRTCPAVPVLTDPLQVQAFIDAFKDFRPDIVVLDTLSTASGGTEENSNAFGQLLHDNGPCGRIKRELGGALVMPIHHAGKEIGRGARGHSSVECNADGLLLITFDKDSRIVTKEVQKVRDGEAGFDVEYTVSARDQVPVVTKKGRVMYSTGPAAEENLVDWVTITLQRYGIAGDHKALSSEPLARFMLMVSDPTTPPRGVLLSPEQQKRCDALVRSLQRAARVDGSVRHLVKRLGSRRTAPWMWSLNPVSLPDPM